MADFFTDRVSNSGNLRRYLSQPSPTFWRQPQLFSDPRFKKQSKPKARAGFTLRYSFTGGQLNQTGFFSSTKKYDGKEKNKSFFRCLEQNYRAKQRYE